MVTTASPGVHRRAQCEVGDAGSLAQALHGVDQLEGGAHRTLRVILLGDRGTPHGHHRIADELLDVAAVPLDHLPAGFEVAPQQLPDVLRIARLGDRGKADQVCEEDAHQPSLRDWEC